MEFFNREVITSGKEKVWRFLTNMESLTGCVPGVENVEKIDEKNYKGTMKIKVGPIGLTFQGHFNVEEIDERNHVIKLRIEGADKKMGGSVKTTMTMKVKEISQDETDLSVVTEAAILGKIGQFGQPLMRKKADSIMAEFAKNVSLQVKNMPDLNSVSNEEGTKGGRVGEFTTADGTNLHYTLYGETRADLKRIVFIHSLALNQEVWKFVVDELSSEAAILTYDCRGHGASSKKAGPYSLQLFADDLNELMTEIGWDSAIVAGCSMGGSVAQAFATAYPNRTEAVCLIDTTAYYGDDASKNWEQRAMKAQQEGLASLIHFQATRWFADAFREQSPEVLHRFTQIFLENDLECYMATCRMLGNFDLREKIGSIKVPCAVIVGEEDYATPVEMGEAIHQAIAGSTFHVLPETRHLSPLERPAEIAKIIRGLLQQVSDSKGVGSLI